MSLPRIIAFYLPQFHPTPDNDRWWGKGFTEWTNVAKAKSLFNGHYQPHIPSDLGFYDLRLPQVREEQALLAREAGIEGFCYWSYWFGNGREQLELPFNEVLSSGKPDFPFMLCWANESWHSKFWNMDGSVERVTIMEQLYPGREDDEAHFYHRLPAFRDTRYIKVDGKPVFMVYEWDSHPNIKGFISIWRELAAKEGLPGIYFIAHCKSEIDTATFDLIRESGFDGINTIRLWDANRILLENSLIDRLSRSLRLRVLNKPFVRLYRDLYPQLFKDDDKLPDVFPTLVPNWDHSPRSGKAGMIVHESTPELFYMHARNVLENINDKPSPNFVFIRAWNEWGEGNHMEPDLKYGKGYIESLRKAINDSLK